MAAAYKRGGRRAQAPIRHSHNDCGGVNLILTTSRETEVPAGVPGGLRGNIHVTILTGIDGGAGIVLQGPEADALVAQCLTSFARGSIDALYDLGVAFSTGSHGVSCDLVEAHKWFNIAAARGHEEAALCRADVSEEMTAREIAEAQRRAREWLRAEAGGRRAA